MSEWTSNLIANKPALEASVRAQVDAIRENFEECWVDGYSSIESVLVLPDEDDRHVLAAAIAHFAEVGQ